MDARALTPRPRRPPHPRLRQTLDQGPRPLPASVMLNDLRREHADHKGLPLPFEPAAEVVAHPRAPPLARSGARCAHVSDSARPFTAHRPPRRPSRPPSAPRPCSLSPFAVEGYRAEPAGVIVGLTTAL